MEASLPLLLGGLKALFEDSVVKSDEVVAMDLFLCWSSCGKASGG